MQRGLVDGFRGAVMENPATFNSGLTVYADIPGTDNVSGRFLGLVTAIPTSVQGLQQYDWCLNPTNGKTYMVFKVGQLLLWVTGPNTISESDVTGLVADLAAKVPKSDFAAKGDILGGTGAGTDAALTAGADGTALTYLAAEVTGLIAANPRSGRERYLDRTGSKGATHNRDQVVTDTPSPTSGTMQVSALYLPKGITINSITYKSGATAAAAPTNWWFALLSSAGPPVFLRSTANQGAAAWAANTEKTLALSSAYTTLTEGLYYFGFLMTAGTTVSLWGTQMVASSPATGTPILNGTSNVGATVPIADGVAATAITAGVNYRWGYAL